MPKCKLSQTIINNLIPQQDRVVYYDINQKYLGYRLGPKSAAFYHIRKIDGKMRYIKLKAATYSEAVVENAKLTVSPEMLPKIKMQTDDILDYDSLQGIFENFMRFKSRRGDSAKAIANSRQRFNDYIPASAKKTHEIKTRDLENIVQNVGVTVGHRSANMLIKDISAAFNYYNKINGTTTNPALAVSRFSEYSRDRYLSESELEKLFEVLPTMSLDFQDFFKIALFTGKRKSNVLSMRYDCIDWDRGEYIFSASENKSRATDVTVLVPEVLEILQRRKGNSPWVFPRYGHPDKHIQQMDRSFYNFCQKAGVENLHQHDLRRTLGSIMAQRGESLHVIAAVLGQTSIGATHIYARLNSAAKYKAVNNAVETICNRNSNYKQQLELIIQNLDSQKIQRLYEFAKNL